jgi:hypothetical protein
MAFMLRQHRESLVEKDDDITACTRSTGSLTWVSDGSRGGSWSEEDESETSSPLVDRMNRPLHHTFTSTSPTNQFPNIPSSPLRKASSPREKKLSKSDYELKKFRDVMIGSVAAVINFLRTTGVPKASADELDENLNNGRYFNVLCRVQHYVQCVPSESNDETALKIHLAVTAWVSYCQLKTLEYKRAFKRTNNLKMEMSVADAKKWKRLQIEMKQSVKEQVKLAEECTSGQKKLYLVQRWEKRQLQRMKRATIIEPEGYQPLPCWVEQ